jgi:hypothetical protein
MQIAAHSIINRYRFSYQLQFYSLNGRAAAHHKSLVVHEKQISYSRFCIMDIHGNLAVQRLIIGEVDFTHAALAYLLQDPIVRNRLADLGHAFLLVEVPAYLLLTAWQNVTTL